MYKVLSSTLDTTEAPNKETVQFLFSERLQSAWEGEIKVRDELGGRM